MHKVMDICMGTEQGLIEVARLIAGTDKTATWEIKPSPRQDGSFTEVWCSDAKKAEEARATLSTANWLIDVLSPAIYDYVSKEHWGTIRNLQRLIAGNLSCVKPPLAGELYDELDKPKLLRYEDECLVEITEAQLDTIAHNVGRDRFEETCKHDNENFPTVTFDRLMEYFKTQTDLIEEHELEYWETCPAWQW